MEIRRGTAADGAACRALWGYCFERPGDPFFEWYFGRVYRPEDTLVGLEEGRAACALHLRPYTLSVRGRTMRADYIVGVAVHPAARGRGLAHELLAGAFRASRAAGKPADILMPSDAALYFSCGFGFYAHQWAREASPERLARLGRRAAKARALEGPEEWALLAGIYRAHAAGRHGYALRDEASWRRHIEGQLREGYIAVVYDEDGPAGYLCYGIDGRTLAASEAAWSSEAGRRGLYAYMAGHRGSVDRCRWYEPLDDASYLFWTDGAEHTYVENRTFPYMMARVTDPAAAFTGLAAQAEGEVSFLLEDGTLPENGGAYTLRARGGRTEAARGGAPAFSLTPSGAAHLLFGALPPEALFAAGEAAWRTDDGDERERVLCFLRANFPKENNWISEWY